MKKRFFAMFLSNGTFPRFNQCRQCVRKFYCF